MPEKQKVLHRFFRADNACSETYPMKQLIHMHKIARTGGGMPPNTIGFSIMEELVP